VTSRGATTVGDVTTDSSATPTATSVAGNADPVVRYRCSACGNLTRFDVVTARRTRAFHHYSVGGDLTIEEVEVLDENVEDVTCRWCGNGRGVEVLDSESAPPTPTPTSGSTSTAPAEQG
jgi:hypothetical protein